MCQITRMIFLLGQKLCSLAIDFICDVDLSAKNITFLGKLENFKILFAMFASK